MILEFQGPYRWLSNFEPVDVEYEGVIYPSVEHAYQAAKLLDPDMRLLLLTLSAGQAKRFPKAHPHACRPYWDTLRYNVMAGLVAQKFPQDPFRRLLLETGTEPIVEGNRWHDTFWGRCLCNTHKGMGQNVLGRLIMAQRELLGAPPTP